MSQTEKDPGIRLFGREIPVPECLIPAKSGPTDACSRIKKTELEMPSQCEENSVQCENSSDLRDSKQESQREVQENAPSVKSKRLKDNMEAGGSDEGKLLKKPDQILQCPRCNSLDTKFCYFNNYNVNQPRHFCKNCQRYWTAGGTMRNVPVGAGRRKNKHLPAQYRHIVEISDGIPASTDSSGSQQQHHISSLGSSVPLRSSSDNGTVLKFGPDTPLCESMDSMLNLRDQKRLADASSMSCVEYGAEPSFRGSSSTSNGTQGNELSERNTSNWLQCYPVPPFVLPYPGWNNVNSMEAVHRQSSAPMCNPYKAGPSAMQWGPTPMVAIPGMCPPTIPLHLVQPSYWSGTPPWNGGAGGVSIGSNACLSPSSSTSNSCCSGNGSPTLGKHARDTVLVDEEKSEKYVLAPKTMRVEAPNEASKNHMRAALVIKHDQQQTVVSNGDALKKIEAKEGKDRESGASQILEANPAAISRAHAFQESI